MTRYKVCTGRSFRYFDDREQAVAYANSIKRKHGIFWVEPIKSRGAKARELFWASIERNPPTPRP
jgi:hypothetical protein